MNLRISPLTVNQVRLFISWKYSMPYDIYNMSFDDNEAETNFFLESKNGYFAIVDESDDLLGFCNFGADARVPAGSLYKGCT